MTSRVNRVAEVYSLLPSLKGQEFTFNDIKRMIGVPNLSVSTMSRLVKQGYLSKVYEVDGEPTIYTVRGL